MGLLCDYFIANSDEEAARTATWPGGPSRPSAPSSGWFRKKTGEPPAALPTVALEGLEPVVTMATLESLVAGGDVDELVDANADAQVNDPRHEVTVFRLSGALTDALAAASPDRLRAVAEPWSRTEELAGTTDPGGLAVSLAELAELAKQARSSGGDLYCWMAP
jgi:hypothetical protein